MNKETIETPAAPQPQQSSYSDGGAAFPCPHPSAPEQGMTLLDWFAGQALAGMMAHKDSAKWTRNEVAGDYHAIVCGDADVTEWINDDIERMALETVEEAWNESNDPRWLAEERQLHELDLMRGK